MIILGSIGSGLDSVQSRFRVVDAFIPDKSAVCSRHMEASVGVGNPIDVRVVVDAGEKLSDVGIRLAFAAVFEQMIGARPGSAWLLVATSSHVTALSTYIPMR